MINTKALKGIGSLLTLRKVKNESISNYHKQYWETYNKIKECFEKLAVASYKLGLTLGERLWENLTLNRPTDLRDLRSWVEKATETTAQGEGPFKNWKESLVDYKSRVR